MNYKKTEINFHCKYVLETKKLIDLISLGVKPFPPIESYFLSYRDR